MNILFVSWFFPPINDVAALRTGAVARRLEEDGHKVTVLTAARANPDRSLAVPVAESSIVRTPWFDIDRLAMAPATPNQDASPSVPLSKKRLFAGLSAIRSDITHIPDRQTGWRKFALAEGRRLMRDKAIDLIYASAPPFSCHLVAKALGAEFNIPWIAEYRDGWSRYAYAPRSPWRQKLDEIMEDRTASTATAIVAVSQPWADYYRARFGKPTLAIYNGYDGDAILPREPDGNRPVSITYVGGLYGGMRDPSALYQAIAASRLTPADIAVVYHGPREDEIMPLAERYNVASYITLKPRVPFAQSLQIQRNSDILLLLQSPEDPRNVPAKLFEYFAVQRPILGIGLDEGIPAQFIRARGAGLYSSDPPAIGRALAAWSDCKARTGVIADVPEQARAGLSRERQLDRLKDILELVRGTGAAAP